MVLVTLRVRCVCTGDLCLEERCGKEEKGTSSLFCCGVDMWVGFVFQTSQKRPTHAWPRRGDDDDPTTSSIRHFGRGVSVSARFALASLCLCPPSLPAHPPAPIGTNIWHRVLLHPPAKHTQRRERPLGH